MRDGDNADILAAAEMCGVKGGLTTGSAIFAVKPGDGSAREQAASCQRFLGGSANIAREYATKRYRSNLINWGMLPLLNDATQLRGKTAQPLTLKMDALTDTEKRIVLDGCLINYYKYDRE